MRSLFVLLALGTLAACGQKGPLYLPDASGEVVTRPEQTPPSSKRSEAPNSGQTPDSQPAAPAPAPEVTAPEVPAPEVPAPEEEAKKDKDASPPPP
jgi:predicted small lipoprotein YifL